MALDTLVNEHNVKVEVYPDDVMAEIKRISAEVIEAEAAKDPFAAKVHADYKNVPGKNCRLGKNV